jgi:hypothetical protein
MTERVRALFAIDPFASAAAGASASPRPIGIKGAIVGGIAGHYAVHHGLLGAAAGCVVGRHEAKRPIPAPSRSV